MFLVVVFFWISVFERPGELFDLCISLIFLVVFFKDCRRDGTRRCLIERK